MSSGTRYGRWLVRFAALAVLALPAAARAAEECAVCHEDQAKAFTRTTHGARMAREGGIACISCHTSGQEHAASGGEAPVLNPAKGKGDEANRSCLTCHEGRPQQAHWTGSQHQLADLKCASCHDVHGRRTGTPAALGGQRTSESTRRCLECHGQIRAALAQRSSHPLREGQMDCASCHNPHGTVGEKLVEKASVNDLCLSCHQQMRGPFLWEHSPVREECTTCHKPHGSNQPSLLTARVTQLCQSCHQQGRHQTIPGVPLSVWTNNRACLNCHSQVHGTNHPSGPLFER